MADSTSSNSNLNGIFNSSSNSNSDGSDMVAVTPPVPSVVSNAAPLVPSAPLELAAPSSPVAPYENVSDPNVSPPDNALRAPYLDAYKSKMVSQPFASAAPLSPPAAASAPASAAPLNPSAASLVLPPIPSTTSSTGTRDNENKLVESENEDEDENKEDKEEKEEREEEMETPQPSPDPFTVDSGKGEEVSSPSGLGGKRGKGGLRVSVQGLKVHSEEQEDGEERPDLDGFALTISSPQGTRPK